MQAQSISIESYIDLPAAEQDAALQRVLSASLTEQVAVSTLRAAGIDEAMGPRRYYSLSLVITGDDEIQALNRQYRHQDQPTDVLSFPLLDRPLVAAPADQLWQPPGGDDKEYQASAQDQGGAGRPAFITPGELATNLGDIVISWPTVARQAAQAGHHPIYELLYLLCHGILHLVGYDDQTQAGYAAMVSIQEAVMQDVGWKAIAG